MESYRYSHMRKGIGEEYDIKLNNKFEHFIFDLEKIIFRHLFKKYFNFDIKSSLDFACGTGRITKELEKYSENSFAIDVSDEMLRIARKKCKKTYFLKADISQKDVLKNKKFDLILAWRFFLNSENTLKKQILLILKKHLKKSGYLIFNIHMNRFSLVGLQFYIRKKIFKQKVINTATLSEIKKLLHQTGYKIIEVYPLAHFPGRLNFLILPQKVLSSIELWLTKIGIFKLFAKDLIFICQKR